MRLRIAHELETIASSDWNALRGAEHPFLRHEFLAALERHRCIHPGNGWQPWHLLLYEGTTLRAAAPAYIKGHSWGEFVFDFSWAEAYARHGLEYYPKLVGAVPYSPVNGSKILVHPDTDPTTAQAALAEFAREQVRELGLSSMHWLFVDAAEAATLARAGYTSRTGTQFHWRNRGYSDFDGFLAGFSAKKRKNVRQERAKVAAQQLDVRVLHGPEVSAAQWRAFHALYCDTFHAHGNVPILSVEFFQDVAQHMGEQVLLVAVQAHGELVAAAWLLEGPDALYGRYWGSRVELPGLHFETCYYRPIEYAIAKGLARFEPGAQGEHKIARGFLPEPTLSAHWLAQPQMQAAVADFCGRERVHVQHYMDELSAHSPFRAN